jgi:hypothetical protein
MPDIDAYKGFRQAAESAIERAHYAAQEMSGTELRQGLEDSLSALADAELLAPDPGTAVQLRAVADLVRRALGDFEKGMLAELGALVEEVRRQLLSGDTPNG